MMMLVALLLVPIFVLGLCAVAATLVGGRADRYMEAHHDAHVYRLPRQPAAGAGEPVSKPSLRASG